MTDIVRAFDRLGVRVPEIFLPARGVDPGLWAVVACDQYSSERGYWDSVREAVGDAPSTVNLIYPECYLEDADKARRIESIQSAMKDYLGRGVLANAGTGFILVERKTAFSDVPRVGLMIAVDLEKYTYGQNSKSLIRPTEGTIVERLPPRMQIRRGAPLELPHIMLLVDDSGGSVIEPVYARRRELPVLYDFDLMKGAGHVKGWHVSDPAVLGSIVSALARLANSDAFAAKHGVGDALLFAVGDGNHSLATAKAVWEEIVAANAGNPESLDGHPGRYALVELVNIYAAGLPFHPIHRALFNVDENEFLDAVRAAGGVVQPEIGDSPSSNGGASNGSAPDCDTARAASAAQTAVFAGVDAAGAARVASTVGAASAAGDSSSAGAVSGGGKVVTTHRIGYVTAKGCGTIDFNNPKANLAAGTVQAILDPWLAAHPEAGIDYIHGTESLVALAEKPGTIGLYLPPVDKDGFFRTVIRDGVMPRKTFSMGEASEKRFYVESRLITPA